MSSLITPYGGGLAGVTSWITFRTTGSGMYVYKSDGSYRYFSDSNLYRNVTTLSDYGVTYCKPMANKISNSDEYTSTDTSASWTNCIKWNHTWTSSDRATNWTMSAPQYSLYNWPDRSDPLYRLKDDYLKFKVITNRPTILVPANENWIGFYNTITPSQSDPRMQSIFDISDFYLDGASFYDDYDFKMMDYQDGLSDSVYNTGMNSNTTTYRRAVIGRDNNALNVTTALEKHNSRMVALPTEIPSSFMFNESFEVSFRNRLVVWFPNTTGNTQITLDEISSVFDFTLYFLD